MHRTPHHRHHHRRDLRRFALAATAIACGALALPAAGQAATTFGSPLTETPQSGINPNATQCLNPPQPVACTRVLIALNKFNPSFPIAAPVSGVVVKFRIKAANVDTDTFKIVRLTDAGGGKFNGQSIGTGPTVTTKADQNAIQEFPARVSMQAGDRVAIDSADSSSSFSNNGSPKQVRFVPPLVNGESARPQTETDNKELLVQAVIEPDSDHDGFGDETQDRCPTNATTAGVCPIPDNGAPSLSLSAIAPGSFRAASSGASASRSRAPIGAKVFYRLSETATVTFGVERATAGRRVGGRCVKRTRANRTRRRCTRYVALRGSFKKVGGAGLNSLRFSGRLNGRKLAVGSYKLVATARDGSGNRSKTRRLSFRIVK